MHSIDAGIRQTLTSLESDFFSALQHGAEALTSFDRAWLAFVTQLEAASDQIQQDTMSKIHSFATTANVVASMLLEVDKGGDNIQRQLGQDMTKILGEEFKNLNIHDKSIPSGQLWYAFGLRQ